ncbi:DUF4350 domain-containing protein [Solwaraspora sp. WMMD791]|uniref:DUF4350 domain-containing protein n=1 Tax=Solwaraspora sp. WMMD791 TaxID=3016086 RepID=UPI00249AF60B|nr:DUF4350 domain-containing protein [Solwaraspora sp. WMMD791]WFE24896.1 DUF4350 domain-containing protein [Solwaraspora sp. WMMD791]
MTRTGSGTTRWRWLRLVVPFVLVGGLFVGTAVAYHRTHPDPTRPGFLSPTNVGPDGGSDLAAALRDDGVTVHPASGTVGALRAAQATPSTLFVPAPTLMHPDYLQVLTRLPAGTRVLLVDPPARLLRGSPLPVDTAGRRWAARAAGPDVDGRRCVVPEVADAGPAATVRQRYTAPSGVDPTRFDLCYDAALARLAWGQVELVVAGANDPFRNDRFGEHRNASFAAGLLGTRPQVVWLDLARPDAPPPTRDAAPQPPVYLPPEDPGSSPSASATPAAGRQLPAPNATAPSDNPLWDAFPPWFWALLAQLALAALVLVLWRARRFGPVVAEPLPVTVPAAETLLGRGQLYRRSRDRAATAGILRTAMLDRVVALLDLPDRPRPAEIVAAVAARTGASAAQVDALLYGPPPTTDSDLLELTRRLAALPDDLAGPGRPTAGPASDQAGPTAPAPRSPSAIEGEPR